jgi:ligand-binding sensor domain-containing protein
MHRSQDFCISLVYFGIMAMILSFFACKQDAKTVSPNNVPKDVSSGTFLNYNQGKFFPNIAFEKFSVEDGLSSASISSLIQDKTGFLWIGTDNGLNRYDGKNFKVWQNDPANPNSYPGGTIVNLAEDSQQKIWMLISGKGVCSFNPQDESFKLYNDTAYQLNLVDHYSTFFIDSKDRLWYRTGYLNAISGVFQKVKISIKPGWNNFVEDTNGNIFSIDCVKRSLLKFDSISQSFEFVTYALPTFETESFSCLKLVDNTTFLASTQGGHFYRFDPFNKKINEHYVSNRSLPRDSSRFSIGGTIKDFYYSPSSKLIWLAQWGGLSRIDTRPNASPKIFRYTQNEENEFSLPDRVVMSVLEDRSGVLWVGTMSGGLAKFAPAKQRFTVFQKVSGDSTTLSNSNVTAIFQDSKERLWVGTHKFLNKVDLQSGKVKTFPIRREDAYGCNFEWITSIIEDPQDGKLLITYWGAGFNWFDPETGKFSKPKFSIPSPSGPCWTFLQKAAYYSPDTILLFEWGSPLFQYNKKTLEYKGVQHFTQNGEILNHGLDYCALIDQQKNIWIGYDQEKGLQRTRLSGVDSIQWLSGNKITKQSSSNKLYLPDEADETKLHSGTVSTLFKDSKNRLWVGTANGLHLMLDEEKGTFKCFGKKNGFPDVGIAGILEDTHGKLWISTNRGISQFDPNEEIVEKNYNFTDGLPGNQFNANACWKNKKGEMFFGGIKGLCAFHPDSLGENKYLPQTTIVQVLADGKPIMLSDNKTKVEIPPSTEHLTIDYAGLDFTRPELNNYRYTLKGVNRDPITTNESRASFLNVAPGEYNFNVFSSNNDNKYDDKGTSLKIIVCPEWWQTSWFKLLSITSLLYLTYFLLKRREKKIIEVQTKRGLQMKSLQVQIHQAQMNPHFIFNVLTAIKSLIINKKPEEAGEYLDKFAVLIRRYLDSSVKSGSVNQRSVVQNEISLAQEIEMIDMYVEFEQLKYVDKFIYERPETNFVKENVSVPPMLIQPYVENAIKHGLLNLPDGKQGHLKVHFSLDAEDALTCLVEDNGVGLEEAKRLQAQSIKHFQSLGTSLTEQRKEILNQLGYNIQIKTEDRIGGGTVVTIKIA